MSFSPFVDHTYRIQMAGYKTSGSGETLSWYRSQPSRGLARVVGADAAFKASLHGKSVIQSWSLCATGAVIFAPIFAYTAAQEKQGERLASFLADMSGWYTHGVLSAAIQVGISFVPFASALRPGLRGLAAMLIASVPNESVTERVRGMFRKMSAGQMQTKRFELGQGYSDTEAAAAMRLSAAQDMSGALTASRRVLGQEARFLHR